MKYANISFIGKSDCNIGDNLQLLAIDHLYACMGVKPGEIIQIPYGELSTWKSKDGEKVILPINFPFLQFNEKGLAGVFSEDIVPVFLGLTYVKPYLTEDEIAYLKKYEPVGCRDEHTYNTMQKYGIDSWLNGCMTLTLFEKRANVSKKRKKMYLVDVPQEIEDKLPRDIFTNNIEKRTHVISKESLISSINEYVAGRMREYEDEAKVIITTRLHCAVPCTSLGIPVILILPKVTYRFAWLERIVPVYLVDEMQNIDWNNCESKDFTQIEFIKEKMLKNAINMIESAGCNIRMGECNTISSYFLDRTPKVPKYYMEDIEKSIDYLMENYSSTSEFDYAVWGLTYVAEMLCKHIIEYYPNAKLVAVFDKNQEICFEGIWSEKIEKTKKDLHNVEVFVTAPAAIKAAKKYFEEIGKVDKFCLCYYLDK